MLNFRLERSPLPRIVNETILKEYNRLTGARIPIEEFEHWVQKGPAGPAWHALLETDEGQLVGHTCLFPLYASYGGARLTSAKSEYSVLHEDFRRLKVRGFEISSLPAFILILDHLFRHCLQNGWWPIFASTNEKNQIFTRKVGLRPLEFQVRECLLILRPGKAAKETPNIGKKERGALFIAGLGQSAAWSVALALQSRANGVHPSPINSSVNVKADARLSFFDDSNSLGWRYLDQQYVRFAVADSPGDYVIAKCGSPDRYVRVCQWQIRTSRYVGRVVRSLVREARRTGAIGVRWAIYENRDEAAAGLCAELKRLGFLCAPRKRIVMVHQSAPEFQTPAAWTMNDSLFSFDP